MIHIGLSENIHKTILIDNVIAFNLVHISHAIRLLIVCHYSTAICFIRNTVLACPFKIIFTGKCRLIQKPSACIPRIRLIQPFCIRGFQRNLLCCLFKWHHHGFCFSSTLLLQTRQECLLSVIQLVGGNTSGLCHHLFPLLFRRIFAGCHSIIQGAAVPFATCKIFIFQRKNR